MIIQNEFSSHQIFLKPFICAPLRCAQINDFKFHIDFIFRYYCFIINLLLKVKIHIINEEPISKVSFIIVNNITIIKSSLLNAQNEN